MGKQPPGDRWFDPPSDVRVTVLQDPGDRRLWGRLPQRRGIRIPGRAYALFVAAAVVAVGVILTTTSFGGDATASRGANVRAHDGGPTGVAAAYGYPSRCLSVTIAASDSAFARADFNHGSPCGRYGDPTAIFHVVDGAWRPVLEAVTYPCPAVGIPAAVQRELGVCPLLTRSRRSR
jgi:hypothetical protein